MRAATEWALMLVAAAGMGAAGALGCSEDESSPSATPTGGTGNEGGVGGFTPAGGTGGTTPVDASVPDVQSDAPPASCVPNFAAAPLSWPVPEGVTPISSSSYSCDPVRYMMSEFTGDGQTDLVAVDDCDPATPLGAGQWEVYPNEGAGFGAAIAYALPPELEADGQNRVTCTPLKYGTRDVTGDGLVDLIVYDDCDDQTPLGSSVWQVHENTGSGFAAPRDWTIPTEIAPTGAVSLRTDPCTQPSYRAGSVVGSAALDLLLTAECTGGATTALPAWRIYEGSDAGFAASFTEWSVPAGLEPLTSDGSYACTPLRYVTRDITGDGTFDLLVTGDCDETTALGTTEWHLHPGATAGFGARVAWPLPLGVATDTDYAPSCSPFVSSMLDADGDGLPDLVLRDDCDEQTPLGETEWHAYQNTGDGFAALSIWTLPPDLTLGTACPDLPHLNRDLNGDGIMDLAILSDCDDQTPHGTDHWLVYLGRCE